MRTQVSRILLAVSALLPVSAGAQAKPDPNMGFFITSVGLGKGADLGGLSGADAHCRELAQAVGAGGRTWRAYLSTQAKGGAPAVNARDRIGKGPWYNAAGLMVAKDLDDLHGKANKLGKENSLTERGAIVNGRGDSPNQHDMLTGTHADGSAFGPDSDMTCSNWTSSATGKAMLGHADRHGVAGNIDSTSWVEAHASSGCSQSALISTGGNGYYYCFAADAGTGLKSSAEGGPRDARPAWNAFGEGAEVEIDLAAPARVLLRIHTLTGALAAEIDAGRLEAGSHRLLWDGRGSAGSPLPRGVYQVSVLRR